MQANPFGRPMSDDEAAKIRAALTDMLGTNGFRILQENATRNISELKLARRISMESAESALAGANSTNCRLAKAEAIEGVFQWVKDAIDHCDRILGGKK